MTAPELWWSPSMQAENPSHGYWGLRWAYTGGGFITPDPLPADAVRLIPATGVDALLRRCDELGANTTNRMRHGGTLAPALISTDEVRALLGVPAPTKENRDAH